MIREIKKLCCALLAAVLVVLLAACDANRKPSYNIDSVASEQGTEVFQPDWDNIAANYRFPEWFVDGKFGIFIHWGLYSVPAFGNEWYARQMYRQGSREFKHHVERWGDQTEFGYKDFIPMFGAERFDADEWVALFKEAGAKYVVPVAEHHDGFSMYDSDLNEWNSVDMGPRRDIVGELKAALEGQDIVFGLSSHRAENAWFYNGGMKFPSDVRDSTITMYGRRYDDQAYTEEWAREWLAHTHELVVKYRPRLFWFDWSVNNPVLMPYFNKFMAFYYNNALDWGEDVVVNTKQGYPTNVHVWDVERGKSDKMMQFPWQTDTAVGTRSWGYIEGEVYKTPGQIVDDLVDIVSKNGNLLLNIGPRPDGTIPEEQQDILRAIGQWLKVNGEAIYGSRPWKKFGEVETEGTKGSFSDNTATAYTARDLRFTTRGNDLYVIALEWGGDDGVVVRSLTGDVTGDAKVLGVTMLGSDEKIAWEKGPEGLRLSFPSSRPCDHAYSFKISFDSPVGENLASEAVNEVMKHGAQ